MQGASMLLGPFGFGITAYEYIHQSGGDLSRVSAIEDIAQERTAPIHQELLAALADKDVVVRAAALRRWWTTRQRDLDGIYKLFADTKYPVRLSAAAAYLRTTGTPGPPIISPPPQRGYRAKKATNNCGECVAWPMAWTGSGQLRAGFRGRWRARIWAIRTFAWVGGSSRLCRVRQGGGAC